MDYPKIITASIALISLSGQLLLAETEKKPNIVFILADDLGWADTSLYGHTKLYETPNIERLAKRGMTFTRAYSDSPLCSPTRSAILTGLSPARTGLTTPNCHTPPVILKATEGTRAPAGIKAIQPNPVSRLETKYETLPKTLKDAGYATGHFGKWHLGLEPYSPLQHGFDIDIPHWPGAGRKFCSTMEIPRLRSRPRYPKSAHRRPHGEGSRSLHGGQQGKTVPAQLLDV